MFITTSVVVLAVVAICIAWYSNMDSYYVKMQKDENIDIKSSIDLTGLPIVTLYQGSKKYHFILDTGSNVSHITNTADIMIIPTKKGDTVYGLEGNKITTPIVGVELYHNKNKYEIEVRVTDLNNAFANLKKDTGVEVTGILGVDFLRQTNKALDFKHLKVHTVK